MIRIQDPNRKNQTFFSPYDEASHTPMTPPTALWCNHVQEEICGLIERERMQLTKDPHQFHSALNFLFETAPVFYEGDLRQEAHLGIKLSRGQTASFMVGLEFDPKLSGSLQDLHPNLTPELLSFLETLETPVPAFFSEQTPSPHLSSDLQNTLSLSYLKLHRPIYRIHLSLGDQTTILIEHGLMGSPEIIHSTQEIAMISQPLQALYNHENAYPQTQAFPVLFNFTTDGILQARLHVRFNEAVFGPFLQGSIRLFHLNIGLNTELHPELRAGGTLSSFSDF